MPAVLPSSESRCPAIIRIEGGYLNELGNTFCNLLDDFAMPPGSIMLHCSLSNLRNEGLAKYIERSLNEVRRFTSMFPPLSVAYLTPTLSALYTTILCG